jgi:hypothetical protein
MGLPVISGLSAALVVALAGSPAAETTPPPRLDIVLTPHAMGDADSRLAVRMRMEHPNLRSEAPLVRVPLKLVGIPRPDWPPGALTARDDQGPIPLTEVDEPPTPQGVYHRWLVGRATVGDVVVSWSAPPRKVTAATNNGPLFDLREENGGFAGSGNGFFAAPATPGPWRIHLAWDLSHAAAGSRGVWSLGEGVVDTVAISEVLQFSYYYEGLIRSFPASAPSNFTFYWLSDPPFDPNLLGEKMRALYTSMAAFFGDPNSSYRVFARQNPFNGTGGTGLAHSFMFGYHPVSKPTVDSLQGLLAHEMAHTWPALQGEHGDTAWYSEGTAEYYSTILSWRAGAITTDRLLQVFNDRADAYYSNPYIHATNPEAAKAFWTDPVAQTVPYGRGWLYLQQTDAEIRMASHASRSLDDVVKALRERQVSGRSFGIADWIALVGGEIGSSQAKAMYDHMVSGGLLVPPADLYAPCFSVARRTIRPFQLGFARASLNDDRVIRGLAEGSAAAQAGLRDGDVITEVNEIEKVRNNDALPLELTVRRGDQSLRISYLPRGAPVDAYRWVRNSGAPDAACRF